MLVYNPISNINESNIKNKNKKKKILKNRIYLLGFYLDRISRSKFEEEFINKVKNLALSQRGFEMSENGLTKDQSRVIIVLKLIAPKLGVLSDFGYYIDEDGKIMIKSNGLERIIKIIELLQKIEIIEIGRNTVELKMLTEE